MLSQINSASFRDRNRFSSFYAKLIGDLFLCIISAMNWLRRKDHRSYNSEGSEDGDMDLAIALSLAEQENKKGKAVFEPCLYPDEDEMLAWALQECLDVESLPRRTLITCAGCKAEIGRGHVEDFMGDTWHSKCIRCHACSRSISGPEAFMFKDCLYHKSCYDQMCQVCLKSFSANRDGRTQYGCIPIWNQKYCLSHDSDGTPRCCSCGQLEPHDVDYATLNDGRELCLECLGSATMNNIECQPLYMDVCDFFEGLSMDVEQQIPLLLVERDALNEAMEKEKNHHHDSLTIGMCLSEEQFITTVVGRPKIGRGSRFTGLRTEPYKVERCWQVTAIVVLYGLPRLFTGSILAHEMMHAWLRLNGYTCLEPDVEEGICQVMAHMWLDSEITASSARSSSISSSSSSERRIMSEFDRKLCQYHKLLIEKNPSRVYGAGFRAARAAVNRCGLRRTLEHIKCAGSLP